MGVKRWSRCRVMLIFFNLFKQQPENMDRKIDIETKGTIYLEPQNSTLKAIPSKSIVRFYFPPPAFGIVRFRIIVNYDYIDLQSCRQTTNFFESLRRVDIVYSVQSKPFMSGSDEEKNEQTRVFDVQGNVVFDHRDEQSLH
jgi:hypothetical protein